MTTIQDDGVSGASGRYAQALYAYADAQQALIPISAQMDTLGRMIESSPALRAVLCNPLIGKALLQKAFEALGGVYEFGPEMQRFLGVVIENRRLAALPEIIARFRALAAQRQGIVTIHVRTAHRLTQEQSIHLVQKFAALGYDPARLHLYFSTDPALLGGLLVRVGAYQYDSTLKSRLQRLQRAMKEAA